MISRIHYSQVHSITNYKTFVINFQINTYDFQGDKERDSASKLKPKQIITSQLSKRQDFVQNLCTFVSQHHTNLTPQVTNLSKLNASTILPVVLKDLCNIKHFYFITVRIHCPILNGASVASNSEVPTTYILVTQRRVNYCTQIWCPELKHGTQRWTNILTARQ
jgi:hypothetical protein